MKQHKDTTGGKIFAKEMLAIPFNKVKDIARYFDVNPITIYRIKNGGR